MQSKAQPLLPPKMTIDITRSPQCIREAYLRKLGYTPLVFQIEQEQQYLIKRSMDKTPSLEDEIEAQSLRDKLIPPPGSIRGSIFNLAGATLGAGALSLPYAVAVSGLLFSLVQLFVAAFLTVYTIRLLIHARERTGFKSYEDLALFCFGPKFAIFVELNILVFCFGIGIAYIVALGDILVPLGEHFFGTASLLGQKWFLMSSFCGVIMLPLSMLRDISSLQFSSLMGVLSIIFLVVAVSYRSTMRINDEGFRQDISWTLNTNHGFNYMLSVPIVMFAFTCQVNVFSIYTELQRPCIRRMTKVVNRATLVSLSVYAAIGVAAYLAFGETLLDPEKKGNILLSFALDDSLIAVCRAAITFTVSVAFPLNIFPCRFTLEMMFFSNAAPSTCRHVIITASLVLSALLLAIFCPGINVVFGVIGGTCSAIVCFCLPAAYTLYIEDGPIYGPAKIGPLILLFSSVILGFVGTYITVQSAISG